MQAEPYQGSAKFPPFPQRERNEANPNEAPKNTLTQQEAAEFKEVILGQFEEFDKWVVAAFYTGTWLSFSFQEPTIHNTTSVRAVFATYGTLQVPGKVSTRNRADTPRHVYLGSIPCVPGKPRYTTRGQYCPHHQCAVCTRHTHILADSILARGCAPL